MPEYRSRTTTHGRNQAGARALWRATGMKEGDFNKPMIAVVNSFTQFVPGHVHLKDMGQLVAREIEKSGGVAKEFNTIAVDDGIAMGHDGMLYSLPSRDLIADSVEYMVNAHWADAMVCISNCDKITPGMLMAAMRINIPVIFVSGGPMEAGKVDWEENGGKIDLVSPMIYGLLPGGKKIRSKILIDVGKIFKINYKTLIKIGAAVESIHAYSLIHDDLPCMDNDSLRRGKLSTHKKFGESTAILAGNSLLTIAFEILSQKNLFIDEKIKVKLINLISQCSGHEGIAGGQYSDLSFEKNILGFVVQHMFYIFHVFCVYTYAYISNMMVL